MKIYRVIVIAVVSVLFINAIVRHFTVKTKAEMRAQEKVYKVPKMPGALLQEMKRRAEHGSDEETKPSGEATAEAAESSGTETR
jgi:hypothetical protein